MGASEKSSVSFKKSRLCILLTLNFADLSPSIVLPGALPAYAGNAAIPRFFKGKVRRKGLFVGKATLQFDSEDKLQHLSIDDGDENGKLIAEEHFGKLKNALPEDLILYREKVSFRSTVFNKFCVKF